LLVDLLQAVRDGDQEMFADKVSLLYID